MVLLVASCGAAAMHAAPAISAREMARRSLPGVVWHGPRKLRD